MEDVGEDARNADLDLRAAHHISQLAQIQTLLGDQEGIVGVLVGAGIRFDIRSGGAAQPARDDVVGQDLIAVESVIDEGVSAGQKDDSLCCDHVDVVVENLVEPLGERLDLRGVHLLTRQVGEHDALVGAQRVAEH